MNTAKESEKLGTVLRSRVGGKLNLATKVRAANAKCAQRPCENGKAVSAVEEVVRTKRKAPSVAVCELDVPHLVMLRRHSGEYRVIRDLGLGGRERLSGNKEGKLSPQGCLGRTPALNEHSRDHDRGERKKSKDGHRSFHEMRATPNAPKLNGIV